MAGGSDNKPLTLPWASCPHILIGGHTGAGKSGVTNAIIAAVAGRADTAICGIDLKLVEQWPWRRRLTSCATTTAEADRLLADLRALIQYRAELLQAIGRRMWSSEFGPWVLVVVDELAELSGSDPDVLVEAARTGDTRDVIRNGRKRRPDSDRSARLSGSSRPVLRHHDRHRNPVSEL